MKKRVSGESGCKQSVVSHLRQDIQPNVDVDSLEAFGDRVIDPLFIAIGEPKGQETQSILQPIPAGQCN